MRIVRQISELALDRSGSVGLVPTMGAFHDGHLALMRRARQEHDQVVVSLFVNPTQFGPQEDYSRYPRDEARDAALAEGEGVDVLFAPEAEEMYPRKTTVVQVSGVTEAWEGEHRPGHFDGVATVVCKLLNIIQPNTAYFGQKDLQQCAVIRRMVEDLNIPVQLSFCETIRESDGLAMSSRNRYLDASHRAKATRIYRTLQGLRESLTNNVTASEQEVRTLLEEAKESLSQSEVKTQYLALVDTMTLEPLDLPRPESSIIFAGYVGNTRLIDNLSIV